MSYPLEVINLTKSYHNKIAIAELSFTIESGEVIGLLGVNGAGKSTLIKCLLDLVDFDAGAISIFGQTHTLTSARSKLSYLGEQFIPPRFATGKDVLRLMAGLEGMNLPTEEVRRHCELLALEESVLESTCQSYSKGMRQKLGLIACLITAKPLMLLDEPMSGLDPLARRLFKDRIIEQREAGRTVFFSTHLLEDISSVCDRVIVLDRGQLKFIGAVDEFLNSTQQANLEAAFLASIATDAAA